MGRMGRTPAATPIEEPHGETPEEDLEDRNDDIERPGAARPSKVRTMRDVNRLVPGVLTVHYIQRDVSLAMDGDAAIRTIATWPTSTMGLRMHYIRCVPRPSTDGLASTWST